MDPIMFGAGIFAFVLAVGLVAAVTRGPQAPGHCRIVGAVFLLAVTAFCVFGFLATFEPEGFAVFRLIYGVVGIGSLIGAGGLVALKTNSAPRSS
jgi:hypothetical protein